jgi:HD superfamily phosphohydrolase YqeK
LALPDWAQVKKKRRAHIQRVAHLIEQWADALETTASERARWLRAAALHDALKDAPPELLLELAPEAWGSDQLRHGPAAAAMARRHGEADQGVLDAVRYHSVGFGGWDAAGRMLYLADYLEPGRQHAAARHAALVTSVPHDPVGALLAVAAERIGLTVAAGQQLLPETVAFWNALACAAS